MQNLASFPATAPSSAAVADQIGRRFEVYLTPPPQPAYRRDRSHQEFLRNLGLPAASVKDVLKNAWSAGELLDRVPLDAVAALVRERYSQPEWIFKF